MTGGYGNGVQQLGAALGAGAQGAGGMDKIIYDRAQAEKEFNQKASEGAANRANAQEVAHIGADSRREVADIKSQAMLERARLIRQPQSNQEMKIVSDAMNKYMVAQENQAFLSKLSPEQRNEMARAYGLGVLETARGATGIRSAGTPLPGDMSGTGEASSTGGAPTGGMPGQGGQGTPGAGAKASSTPTLDTYLNAKGAEADKFRSLIQTPAGQQQLLQIKPDLKPIIDEFNARWGPQQGSAIGGAFDALKRNWQGALGQ
jgi:hypothetical protein